MTRMVESPNGAVRRDILRRQGELVQHLCSMSRHLRTMKDSRPKKIEWLQRFISDPKNGLLQFSALPLPLDAQVEVQGIVPEKAMVFKSALMPLLLTFQCTNQEEYSLIFKLGDDLRQDQLIMQVRFDLLHTQYFCN